MSDIEEAVPVPDPQPTSGVAMQLNPALWISTGGHIDGKYHFKPGEPVEVDPADVEHVQEHHTSQFAEDYQTVVTAEEAEAYDPDAPRRA